ncbi:cobalt-precorrin-5B (C(1))-methyltransferase CbiD [Methanococcus voltae]|uniref:Cobalt-precorrin-5B C(1)-methyltransferase n=1 Tax=Methanococcus voltae (strain ATCC BAA-1334 / A3) TaxID=456320 RepID=D7DR51_METV3|nr:cobalt-precorrin-5B (C(1))-methyltransferase CbiD [Methanococcus voltae]MCS3900988.1 cobalt-precorrin-5B (C1)-methyltransferase [Methanococcus voltae]
MKYDFRNEKSLGYTTGSCACAGAYSGLYYLKKGKILDFVEIENPNGEILIIPIEKIIIDPENANYVRVVVKKFSGEDIDITNGEFIEIEVNLLTNDNLDKLTNLENSNLKEYENKFVIVNGGKGVGYITKEGLQIEVGDYAINPKPREMIIENCLKLLDKKEDGTNNIPTEKVEITISVPNGLELAKKTLNPKLGIIDGISILGTTGIVRPMSNDAYKNSLVPQIDVALSKNYTDVIFVAGNIGTKYAKKDENEYINDKYFKMGFDEDKVIEVSNFWDFMLDKALEKGIKEITIYGHSGKIVKLAGGIYNTHSKVSDARNEILTAYSAQYIDDKEIIAKMLYANTTEEINGYLKNIGILETVYNEICKRVVERAEYRWDKIKFNCHIIGMKGEKLGKFQSLKK